METSCYLYHFHIAENPWPITCLLTSIAEGSACLVDRRSQGLGWHSKPQTLNWVAVEELKFSYKSGYT